VQNVVPALCAPIRSVDREFAEEAGWMKAVILAGGLGTRLSEETTVRPKPMVEIGGRPILWHILKVFSAHGINDFVICAGYRGTMIKDFFANYFLHNSDVTFDMRGNRMEIHQRRVEPWKVSVVDTGDSTMTGGRLKRVREYLDGETFCFTYGDGVANVDLQRLVSFHHEQRTLATLTAVRPPGRFGAISLAHGQNQIHEFREKPAGDGSFVNGGFFVLEMAALDYIDSDQTVWEREPLERLAHEGQLSAYRHDGFWQPMDTLRDRQYLETLWDSGDAPWKIWSDQPAEVQNSAHPMINGTKAYESARDGDGRIPGVPAGARAPAARTRRARD
jgi:glucose-1-phosphate cytidylyltransferase